MKILDTGFLIDLQRDWVRGQSGATHRFLQGNARESCAVSAIGQLEFLDGYARMQDGEVFLEPFIKLPVTEEVARAASRLHRRLRQAGDSIGDFDTIIAATALTAGAALVTANLRHFERVADLDLIPYRTD